MATRRQPAQPEGPKSPLSALHDNRILLGDCLDVLRSLPDASVDAIVTDPPYGMDYQSARRSDKSKRKRKIANDIHPFIWWLYDAYRITQTGGRWLVSVTGAGRISFALP